MHRPPDLSRDQRNFDGVIMLIAPVKATTGGHREQNDIFDVDTDCARGCDPGALGRLGSDPKLQLAINKSRGRRAGLVRGMQSRLDIVAQLQIGRFQAGIGITALRNALSFASGDCAVKLLLDHVAINEMLHPEACPHRVERLLSRPPACRYNGQPAFAFYRSDNTADIARVERVELCQLSLVERTVADRCIDHAGQTHITCEQERTIDF